MSLIGNFLLNIFFIIVGILITPYVDDIRKKLSESFRNRTETKKKVFENTVQFIIENPYEEIILRSRVTYMNLLIVFGGMFGMLMITTNNVVSLLLGYLLTFIALFGNYRISRLQQLIYKVNEHKSKKHPNIDLELYYPKSKKAK